MSVKLSELIARKTYRVPIKAVDLCDAVLKQLKLADSCFGVLHRFAKSAAFSIEWDIKYAFFCLISEGKTVTQQTMLEKREKYSKDPIANVSLVMESMKECAPTYVRYIVVEEGIESCTIKTDCKPVLYDKILREMKIGQADPEHSRLVCEDFLDDVFIGGVGGKEIREDTNSVDWKLLFNDAHTREISEKVNEMLSEATSCVLLMGWIGTDCIPKLRELVRSGVTVKAVAHNPSELKGPVSEEIQKGYAELVEAVGLTNVSNNRLLHGRALIIDNRALVGSMDLNSFSLSGQHIEFAVYIEDFRTVRLLKNYFESIFKPLKELSAPKEREQ